MVLLARVAVLLSLLGLCGCGASRRPGSDGRPARSGPDANEVRSDETDGGEEQGDAGTDPASDGGTSDGGFDPAPDGGRPDGGSEDGGSTFAPWESRVLYLMMTDRFANGDPANDLRGGPCPSPPFGTGFTGGDFAGVRQRLGYLEELGVSALWMTPAYLQVGREAGEGCGFHGYWPDFVDPDNVAVEPRLGTEADLKALSAELRERRIAFMLDLIVNHSGRRARLQAQRPSWFHDPATCGGLGDPIIYCPLSVLPDLAQERADVAGWLEQNGREWVRRFQLDGVRMDTAKHVERRFFKDRWIPAVRAERPELFLLAEVFIGGTALDLKPFLEAGFDSAFHFPLYYRLLESLARGGSLDPVAAEVVATVATFGQAGARRLVTFLDNHDVPRFITGMGALSTEEARRRYFLAATALFTLPGIPQLYQGDELGQLGDYPQNRQMMPLWAFTPEGRAGSYDGYLADPQATFQLFRKLATLRRDERSLWAGDYVEMWRPNGVTSRNVLAFYRWVDDRGVIVALNNTPSEVQLDIPFVQNSGIPQAHRDAFPGSELVELLGLAPQATASIVDGRLRVALPGRSAVIYRRK